VEQEFGRLDVLVNNAGILFGALGVTDKQSSSVDNTLVELRKTFETNTFGPFAVTEIFLPLLQRSSHPRIVYVSSDLGSIKTLVEKKFLKPSMSYRMSKAALDMLAMYHAVKFDTYGIKVGVFNPGYVVTALGNPGMDLDAWRDFRRSNGGRDSMESALRLVDVIQGKRDSDLTRGILDASGEILPW
jgi:NAD(P)-dependent dehydrogenase (short-subunit alcohol dehydrogenase family)